MFDIYPLSFWYIWLPYVSYFFNSQDFISNSPYYLPYSLCDVSL